MSSGGCKIKQQWNTLICLLQQPKCTILTTPNTGHDVEQKNLLFIERGDENGTDTLEDTWEVSYNML
jgi:hypothetical protein